MVLPGWRQTAARNGSARRASSVRPVLAAFGVGYAYPTQRIRLACTAVAARGICLSSRWPTSHSGPLENQAVAASAGSHPKALEPLFAGLLRMNLGRYPGNYLRVTQNHPEIVENCAFWASLAHESERAKCRSAGGGHQAGIQCRPLRSLTLPRFLSFRLLMRQRSRDRSNRAVRNAQDN